MKREFYKCQIAFSIMGALD